MTSALPELGASGDRDAIDRFRQLLAERLGLVFDESRTEEVEEAIRERARASGAGHLSSYVARLCASAADDEIGALAERLTVGETYFFRNPNHFRAFSEVVLAARARRPMARPLRILSAGCSSGEEAYTLAITAREALGDAAAQRVEIVGIDLNPAMVDKARRARYSAWSLRATSAEASARWFRRDGQSFVLDDSTRRMVTFEQKNLLDDAGWWQPGSFDVVFCRNVLIYFSREALQRAIDRFRTLLRPGGFLFLGDAESLRGTTAAFALRSTHDTFYYQVADGRATEPQAAPAPPPRTPSAPGIDTGCWMGAIHGSSQRIAELERSSGQSRVSTPEASVARPVTNSPPASQARREADGQLAAATELLARERFADAIAVLDALPQKLARSADAVLLRAAAQTNRGDIAEAERLCAELLARAEHVAGAHYVLALCREQNGDLDGARTHDRAALEIDPRFAMARMHLGLLARRAGSLRDARRELEEAGRLLQTEDATRIAIFGGGFTREALAAHCRAELRRTSR